MQTKPVIEIDEYGNKYWHLNDQLHRIDGPAIEYINGDMEWWLDDNEYTFEEWIKLTPLSEQEKVKLRLHYAK